MSDPSDGGDGAPLHRIGDELALSRERMRRIGIKAPETLRDEVAPVARWVAAVDGDGRFPTEGGRRVAPPAPDLDARAALC